MQLQYKRVAVQAFCNASKLLYKQSHVVCRRPVTTLESCLLALQHHIPIWCSHRLGPSRPAPPMLPTYPQATAQGTLHMAHLQVCVSDCSRQVTLPAHVCCCHCFYLLIKPKSIQYNFKKQLCASNTSLVWFVSVPGFICTTNCAPCVQAAHSDQDRPDPACKHPTHPKH